MKSLLILFCIFGCTTKNILKTNLDKQEREPSSTNIKNVKREPSSRRWYKLEKNINDEYFIINEKTYQVRLSCYGFREGDSVAFIEGSGTSYSVCVSAKILNKRSAKTCDLWCK